MPEDDSQPDYRRVGDFLMIPLPFKSKKQDKLTIQQIMKLLQKLIPILLLLATLFMASCATIKTGQDPIVVHAERTTQLAMDTFSAIEKLDYDSYAAFKAVDAASAAASRNFVNGLRRHQHEWLTSARDTTQAYKNNRTPENKANLSTAIAVLTSATQTASHYIAEMQTKVK